MTRERKELKYISFIVKISFSLLLSFSSPMRRKEAIKKIGNEDFRVEICIV